jgi:hypothetical protein
MATGQTNDESTRDFYPEDAADINFKQAAEAAAVNAQADVDRQAKLDAETEQVAPDAIPAQPDVAETTNPEQVKVEEPADNGTAPAADTSAPAAPATDTTSAAPADTSTPAAS